MGEQRHMAEEVVEHVRLFEIIEFAFLANPPGDWKPPVGQMLEEFLIGDQAGNGNDLEPGQMRELLIDATEIGNSVGDVQTFDAGDEFLDRIARDQFHLMAVKPSPTVMIDWAIVIERLLDRIVETDGG